MRSQDGRPRVLFVGRARLAFPLSETLRRRFDALSAEIDWIQLATAAAPTACGDRRFQLLPRFPVARLDGLVYHLLLPLRVARVLRRLRPDVAIVQGTHETALVLIARRLARVDVAVVCDIHGDWRSVTRVYGSPARRALSPLADMLARLALRRADGVRTVSGFTTRLVRSAGIEPTSEFPAYMDLEPFLGPVAPLPATPTALFIGVLERYKGVDVLVEAWPEVIDVLPAARLEIVGAGRLEPTVAALVDRYPGSVGWTRSLETREIARVLDRATLLVLPSRREGMGRVVVEALCRGRCVVGTSDGGIADLVDVHSGVLLDVLEPSGLADALVQVLGSSDRAKELGAGAWSAHGRWNATPAEFARRTRDLVEAVRPR
jgi:glycosyltransferase involved in cell wall biosynthesis